MLMEALMYLATPAGWNPARAGLVRKAVGLWSRGHRCRKVWERHLTRTKTAVESVIDEVKPRDRCAILGSGPLFDVPLDALCDFFDEVVLVDIVHLFPAYYHAWVEGNIRLETLDLSGAGVLADGRGVVDPLAKLRDDKPFDLVVSLNLLSQLGHGAPEGQEQRVIAAHLASLARFPGRVVLVTDVSYVIEDRAGTIIERFDLLYGERLPEPDRQWIWEVCPFGEEAPDRRRLHTVHFYADWHAASGLRPEQMEFSF